MKNFHVPGDHTYYNCMLFKVPKLENKHHIVKFEPIIQEGHEPNVHHMLVYRCGDVLKDEDELEKSAKCYSPSMKHYITCTTVIAAWALGASPIIYPEVAGMSIGAEGDPVYIQIEIHYDNPLYRRDIIDNSGIRFTYTDKLRQHDIGVLTTGVVTSGEENFIPPRTESFTAVGHCTPFCLSKMIENSGYENITAFSVMLHSHLAGRSLRLRHIRDGVELPFIADDQHYDFNYQELRHLNPHVTIEKNDYIRTECVYNTKDRENVTQFGLGTYDEMCLSFVFYYPKIVLSQCLSSVPYQASWGFFGISSDKYIRDYNAGVVKAFPLEDVDVTDQVSPNSSTPVTLHDYLNSIEWTPEKVKLFEIFYNSFMTYGVCVPDNFLDSSVKILNATDVKSPYVEPRKRCLEKHPALSRNILATNCFETATSSPLFVLTRSSQNEQPTTIQGLKNSSVMVNGQQGMPPEYAAAIIGTIFLALAAALKVRR